MQTFAIVNLGLCALLFGYVLALADRDDTDRSQLVGASVFLVILDVALCCVVLLHG